MFLFFPCSTSCRYQVRHTYSYPVLHVQVIFKRSRLLLLFRYLLLSFVFFFPACPQIYVMNIFEKKQFIIDQLDRHLLLTDACIPFFLLFVPIVLFFDSDIMICIEQTSIQRYPKYLWDKAQLPFSGVSSCRYNMIQIRI